MWRQRARDLLVVPVLGMDRIQGWLTPLDKALSRKVKSVLFVAQLPVVPSSV